MGRKAPQRAKRPCLASTCKGFASNQGYCDNHQDKIRKKDRERGTAYQRGYDHEWEVARKEFLELNPLCVDHRKRGYIEVATVVDHIIPHKGDKKLFKDKTNWQPLCKSCHDRKTQLEDRGAWNYQSNPIIKKEVELFGRVNPFVVHDWAEASSAYAVEILECKFGTKFLVTAVCEKLIEVSDADGFIHRLHYCHFKKHV